MIGSMEAIRKRRMFSKYSTEYSLRLSSESQRSTIAPQIRCRVMNPT